MDVERCVNGTRRIGDIFKSQSMDYFKFSEMGQEISGLLGLHYLLTSLTMMKWLIFVDGL